MTLKELYYEAKGKRKPDLQGQAFIKEICDVTKKSEASVRRWLCDGETSCAPDALTQEVLAKHFKTTPEELFPRQ